MTSFNNDNDFLTLSLSNQTNPSIESPSNQQPRIETAPDPIQFNWASDKPATVHSLDYLLSRGITAVSSGVVCKKCGKKFTIEYELTTNFNRLKKFIEENKVSLAERAAEQWKNPVLPDCKFCNGKKCVNPVKEEKKENINWLFLLVGDMLGCCTLGELKYFCKHNKMHRSGAKDRVLYLTYLGLCNQLQPDSLFSN